MHANDNDKTEDKEDRRMIFHCKCSLSADNGVELWKEMNGDDGVSKRRDDNKQNPDIQIELFEEEKKDGKKILTKIIQACIPCVLIHEKKQTLPYDEC